MSQISENIEFYKHNNLKFKVKKIRYLALILIFCYLFANINILANEINPYTVNLQKINNQKVYLSELTNNTSNISNTKQTYLFIENDLIYNKATFNIYRNEIESSIFSNNESSKNLKKISTKDFEGCQILGLISQNNKFGYYLFLTGIDDNYCLTRLDKNLNLISNQKILTRTQTLQDYTNYKVVNDLDVNIIYLLIDNSLFVIDYASDNLAFENIDKNIVQISENSISGSLIYAKDNGNFINIFKYDKGVKSEIANLDFGYNLKIAFEEVKLKNQKNTYCYVLNGFENSVLLNVIKLNKINSEIKKIRTAKEWYPGSLSDYNFIYNNGLLRLFELNTQNQNSQISIYNFENSSKIRSLKQIEKIENGDNFSKIRHFKFYDNKILLIFNNSVKIFSTNLDLLAEDYFNVDFNTDIELKNNNYNIFSQFKEHNIVINHVNKSYIFELSRNNFWYFSRLYQSIGKYLFPLIIILLIFILYRKIRKQKRLVRTLLELPGAGFILVFDKDGNLTTANNSSRDILRLDYNVPMNRFFKFYCDNELNLPLFDFFQKAFETKHNLSQRLNLIIDNKVREYYCNTMVLRNVTGNFKGLIITGIDITEELERQRLINWAQLAHDLQTNLSIIKLNAENLESLVSDSDKPRVEKISQQANIIFHRIRDLVTVGSSRSINKHSHKSIDLVDEIIGEFDLSLIPNIKINKNVKNFDVFCDKPKMIRCIRNATENSIKVLKQIGGEITIKCYKDDKYAVFVVEDNGPGMDEMIKKRMLSPFFTTNQDDGGSGIGTMIMLNVMEQHGGKLLVESEKGKGTKMIFRFPNIQA